MDEIKKRCSKIVKDRFCALKPDWVINGEIYCSTHAAKMIKENESLKIVPLK